MKTFVYYIIPFRKNTVKRVVAYLGTHSVIRCVMMDENIWAVCFRSFDIRSEVLNC